MPNKLAKVTGTHPETLLCSVVQAEGIGASRALVAGARLCLLIATGRLTVSVTIVGIIGGEN